MDFGDRFKSLIVKLAMKFIASDDVKERIITKINEKIDIPFLDEQMEEELLDLIGEIMEEVLEEIADEG